MKKEDKKRLTKELLKEWQRTHYQEYCDFSDMMHDRNGVGFDKVYAEAIMMIPKFEKALFLYLKNDRSENIDDLESLLKDEGIVSQLSLHFFAQLPDSYTPAMLCWLFFGRSFECMVEYGEEMIRQFSASPSRTCEHQGYHQPQHCNKGENGRRLGKVC